MFAEVCSIFYCVDVLWKHVVIFLVYNTNYEMCGLIVEACGNMSS